MMGLGIWELILIVLVVMFFFGAKRIPQIARGVGAGIRNFKGELKEGESPPPARTVESGVNLPRTS